VQNSHVRLAPAHPLDSRNYSLSTSVCAVDVSAFLAGSRYGKVIVNPMIGTGRVSGPSSIYDEALAIKSRRALPAGTKNRTKP
jgi:hypothetical protein